MSVPFLQCLIIMPYYPKTNTYVLTVKPLMSFKRKDTNLAILQLVCILVHPVLAPWYLPFQNSTRVKPTKNTSHLLPLGTLNLKGIGSQSKQW
ncbi:hypothetical protein MXB_4613 [Myxobolus squamalis]|nr:hypothetical protein MXB_4613 [Myxobolus squamalis]